MWENAFVLLRLRLRHMTTPQDSTATVFVTHGLMFASRLPSARLQH